MAQPSLCPCGNPNLDHTEMIFCDSCLQWFHRSCANLPVEQFQSLADSSDPWHCSPCLQSLSQTNFLSGSSLSSRFQCPVQNCQKSYKFKKRLETHILSIHPEIDLPLSINLEDPTDCVEDLISRLGVNKQKSRILKRIPKGARPLAAIKLAEVLDNCTRSNDVHSWSDLLLFPSRAFQIPTSKGKSLTSLVKLNIHSQLDPQPTPPPNQTQVTSLARRVESKLSEGDVAGAVRLLSSDDTLAPRDETTYQALLNKHPCPSRPPSWSNQPEENQLTHQFSERDVSNAILSFALGSSGGIDCLRPQHLRDLTSINKSEASSHLLRSLTEFCNFVFAGKLNPDITKIFFGANLCALNKKDGGVRPIAVGLTLRRLVAKLACNLVKVDMGNLLRPHQLGFGTRGGCEAAVHATRSFLNSNKLSNKVILKVDVKNAFNSLERDSLLHSVERCCPSLLPFLWQCYRHDSLLFFGEKIIKSKVGAQQGDPAGPLTFSLAIQNTIEELSSELNVWYLDDGTIGGDPDTVLQDATKVISGFKELGLEVNPSKCELIFCSPSQDPEVRSSFESIFPGINVLEEDSYVLLGAPLSPSASDIKFQEKLSELERLSSRLSGLNHHSAYYLLRNCLYIPKLNYLLRSSPSWKSSKILEEMEKIIYLALSSICNVNLTESQITLASLPLCLGGLSIRKLSDINVPAFISSVSSTFDLVKLILCLPEDDLSLVHGTDEAIELWTLINGNKQPLTPSSQKNWDLINSRRIFESLTTSDDIAKARKEALLQSESSAWLHALPSRALGTVLDNNTFRVAIAIRLGSGICHPHTCTCGVEVNELGLHGLSCKFSKGRHSRHAEINDIIKRALSSSHFPSVLEPTGLLREDGKRPDGMTLIPWFRGMPLVWDATCTDTFANYNLPNSSKSGGAAAINAASRKSNKYKTIIEQNYHFVPFAVETMGPWCPEAKLLIYQIGNLLRSTTGEPRSSSFITQRISLAIQRGNAASIMGTFSSSSAMEEIFYIL